jgi:hypothetical protein
MTKKETKKDPKPVAGVLALVGLWRDVADAEIDAFVRDIYAERERDKGRPVDLAPTA